MAGKTSKRSKAIKQDVLKDIKDSLAAIETTLKNNLVDMQEDINCLTDDQITQWNYSVGFFDEGARNWATDYLMRKYIRYMARKRFWASFNWLKSNKINEDEKSN